MAGIFKILGTTDADGAIIELFDAIEWRGDDWIVVAWHEGGEPARLQPARIIRVGRLARGAVEDHRFAYGLKSPMPKELFDLAIAHLPGAEYEVVDLPPILLNVDGHPREEEDFLVPPRRSKPS